MLYLVMLVMSQKSGQSHIEFF